MRSPRPAWTPSTNNRALRPWRSWSPGLCARRQRPPRDAAQKRREDDVAQNVAPGGAAVPGKIEFDDPHATAGPVEGEVTHVRRLTGIWRWMLVIMTAATIALCINQQFNLRFFVGYTHLNTEYYYLLIFCMLPFTFLIFPGSAQADPDRIPWYDALLFVATVGSALYLMFNVRQSALLGWEF